MTDTTNQSRSLLLALAAAIGLAAIAVILIYARQDRTPSLSPPSSAPEIIELELPAEPPPPSPLAQRIKALGQSFDGRVGIVVRSVEDDWAASFGAGGLFPQQSLSKLWVSAAVLDQVDAGNLQLPDKVILTRKDLTIFHQPIRERIGNGSFTTDIADLMRRAITQSDNTANDALFRRVGGQNGVGDFLVRHNLAEIAIGPGEKILQTQASGMSWHDSYSYDRNFWQVRETIPPAVRAKALTAYVADAPDAATPAAIARALARLKRGELLSPGSTALLLDLMAQSKTGPDRLRGGLSQGWSLAHKTGTGQVMGAYATAYNDVGILTSPAGRHYVLAVLIASTRQSVPIRQALMSNVTRTVIACEGATGC